MPREHEPSVNEKTWVLEALARGLRLDGRAPEEYRTMNLSFGEEYGVAEVRLGDTRVLAKVTAEVTAPYPDRPADGIFIISAELSPMTSAAIDPGRNATEAEVLLARLLDRTIRRSGALDTESLCLRAGREVWSVRADLHAMSHDGNLVDAACLAAVAALRHFRKPDATVEGEELRVYLPAEREPVPLGWMHSPLCVTFSYFDTGRPAEQGEEKQENGKKAEGKMDKGKGKRDKRRPVGGEEHKGPREEDRKDGDGGGWGAAMTLVDATWIEEQVRIGSMTISLNRHGEICHVLKPGGQPVEAVELLRCAAVAVKKVRAMSDLLDSSLAEDATWRDKGGLIAQLLASENDR